jgi:hypothetical protein
VFSKEIATGAVVKKPSRPVEVPPSTRSASDPAQLGRDSATTTTRHSPPAVEPSDSERLKRRAAIPSWPVASWRACSESPGHASGGHHDAFGRQSWSPRHSVQREECIVCLTVRMHAIEEACRGISRSGVPCTVCRIARMTAARSRCHPTTADEVEVADPIIAAILAVSDLKVVKDRAVHDFPNHTTAHEVTSATAVADSDADVIARDDVADLPVPAAEDLTGVWTDAPASVLDALASQFVLRTFDRRAHSLHLDEVAAHDHTGDVANNASRDIEHEVDAKVRFECSAVRAVAIHNASPRPVSGFLKEPPKRDFVRDLRDFVRDFLTRTFVGAVTFPFFARDLP